MIYDLRDIQTDVLKTFDGTHNYFNCSEFNGKITHRKESIYFNKILVSDIVDNDCNILLKHTIDNNILYSYEDARLINDTTISVSSCIRPVNDLSKITNVKFQLYDFVSNSITHFKTQNTHFEKHWQFHDDKIIYHVNPYTIMNLNEEIVYTNIINFEKWISLHGKPGLSTNIFRLDQKFYVLFHSYVAISETYFKYFVGVLQLNNELMPEKIIENPLFESNYEYSDKYILENVWAWRNVELSKVIKYEVIFPLSVSIINDNINIYGGLNDCSSVRIVIPVSDFLTKINV